MNVRVRRDVVWCVARPRKGAGFFVSQFCVAEPPEEDPPSPSSAGPGAAPGRPPSHSKNKSLEWDILGGAAAHLQVRLLGDEENLRPSFDKIRKRVNITS